MADLPGVLSVIAAYPVHILTFLGCILLLVLVWPKRKRQHKHFQVSTKSTAEKKEFTQTEKHALAEKINESRIRNLKKSSAIDENTNYMIFATIILIMLSLAFIVGAIIPEFRKFFFAFILLFIIGVILIKIHKYLLNLWNRKKHYTK